MSFKFCSLSSGSSGNSYYVGTETTSLLVDAGIPGKNIVAGLARLNLGPEDLTGILVTHEHSDHIKCLQVIHSKAPQAKIYASHGTIEYIEDKIGDRIERESLVEVDPENGEFELGDVRIKPFNLSHDANMPIGFALSHEDRSVAIVTDTGVMTDEIFESIKEVDLLALEANYEENVLLMGRYPYYLKHRILGDHGHLSNEDAANCIVRMLIERKNTKPPIIALSHTSKENNTPDLAFVTVSNILYESNYIEGKDYRLKVLLRDTLGEIIDL